MKSDTLEHLHLHLQGQRAAYLREPFPTLAQRRDRLQRLRRLVAEHGEAFIEAVSADFGQRSRHETELYELAVMEATTRHALKHLREWMQVQRVKTALHFLPGNNKLMPQPLGVVGVIAPWNYPVLLALAPVVAALAAGNRVMLKPSELTPRTSQLLARAVAQYFAPDEFTVITGDARVAQAFASLRFDHLFFTGSTAVGRQVAQQAAANLTPVTLELGGKSPALVHESADLLLTAERIAHGKLVNAGQTCVAPDYVLVPKHMARPLADAIAAAMKRLYPTLEGNDDYSSIVSPRHHARLQGMLVEAKAMGAQLIQPHKGQKLNPASRKLAPTLVLKSRAEMQLRREEIFGPILPLIPYTELDEAIEHIQREERPLALYWFGKKNEDCERVLRETHAGGVTLNDCIWHLGQEEQPFGGVGASGQGSYHGEWGFRTFSKDKPVFDNPPLAATRLLYPPYGPVFEGLLAVLKRIA
ncbi:MAG: coniferyl aldehyde dehydrogenase [Burkholderiales bacterium]|uniref:coniferyl aldehyde dehydrogenase n=1 Tax=Inhella sp. TaxID=1921806 RepID=UPI001ACB63DF|nr:coniferyl aldehyde dehydrogenase [Burkholderiales bacterium]